MMRVSSKLSDVNEFQCDICMEPSFTPLYHCRFNHVTCVTCYYDYYHLGVNGKCQMCHKAKDNTVSECNALTALVNRMHFQCPNIYEGCPVFVTLEEHEPHVNLCQHTMFWCPVCGRGYDDKMLLLDHFLDHRGSLFTYGQAGGKRIKPGKYLLMEKTRRDFYLLLFMEGSISLQHMVWGEKKSYEVYAFYEDAECDMGFCGQTEVVRRQPGPNNLSLRVPSQFSNQRTRVRLTVRENEPEQLSAASTCTVIAHILPLSSPLSFLLPFFSSKQLYASKNRMRVSLKLSQVTEIFCHICNQPSLPPVFHCRSSHLTCGPCYNNQGAAGMCQKCQEGEDDILTECTSLTSLLNKMEFPCPNTEEGCPFYVTVDKHNEHLTSCKNSTFLCPICGRGFEERVLLTEHFLDHSPTEVTYGEFTETTINPGGYLFREHLSGDYFFLLYQDEAVGLQHMAWGAEKKYEASLLYETDVCSLGYNGRTEMVERWPKPSHVSLRIPQMVSKKSAELSLKII